MRWTRTLATEVKVTPWAPFEHYGLARVRIWVQTDGARWWQCHEWERAGGNRERSADGWIACPPGWPASAAEPQPGEAPPPDNPLAA